MLLHCASVQVTAMSFLEDSVSYGSEYCTAAKSVRISVCHCGPVSAYRVGMGDASLLQRHAMQPLQRACCLVLSSHRDAGPQAWLGNVLQDCCTQTRRERWM